MLEKLHGHLARGEYLQAKREAERLLMLGGMDDADISRVYRAGGKACLELREYYAAVKLLELAVEYGKRAGDWDVVGRARHNLGVAYLWLGDFAQAEQVLNRWLRDLPRYQHLQHAQAEVYVNLGILYRHRHHNAAALAYYAMGQEMFTQFGQWRGTVHCLLNCAWIHLMERRPAEAARLLEAAAHYLQSVPDPDLQAHYFCMKALLARIQEDYSASMAYCEEIFAGRPGASDYHLSEASWIAGENALDLGRMSEARIFASLAMKYALQARYPLLMNLACDLKTKIAAAEERAAD